MKSQRGFSILQLMVVLTVAGIAAAHMASRWEERGRKTVVDNAAVKVMTVVNAARRYRLDNDTWPASISDLRPAYLSSSQANPPLGGSYTFSTASTNFRLRFSASESVYARRLVSRLPEGRRFGTTVQTEVGIPGWETSLDGVRTDITNVQNDITNIQGDMTDLYHLDGIRPIRDTFAGGGQDAADLADVYAQRLIDDDDNNYIVDPHQLSVFNDINADSTDTDTLRIASRPNEGDPCNASSNNIAVGVDGVLTCRAGTWQPEAGGESFTARSSHVFSHSGSGRSTGRYSFNVPSSMRDAKAVMFQSSCDVGGNDTVRASVGPRYSTGYRAVKASKTGDSGHGYLQHFTFTVPNTDNDTDYSLRFGGGHHDCEGADGLDIFVIGYWE